MNTFPNIAKPGFRVLACCALVALASCTSSAFMNLDPWTGSVKEKPDDAWVSGGKYRGSAITSSAPSEPAEHGNGENSQPSSGAAQSGDLGGLQSASSDEKPLLAWDGDVVDGPQVGKVVERADPARGLDPAPGGRTYLLQLYQQVLDERDSLEDEVHALRKALSEAQARLDSTAKDTAKLSKRVDALAADVSRLSAENDDLAARLATAQIRRLEAEKMLLEARIEWYHDQDKAESTGDLTPSLATGSDTRAAGAPRTAQGGRP